MNVKDLIEQNAQDPGPLVKVANYVAAVLGIGTLLQLVNVVVGLLSALWLSVQLWSFFKYERPRKLMALERERIELDRAKGRDL